MPAVDRTDRSGARERLDAERLLDRLRELGDVGRDGEGRLTRLAASDADRAARDRIVRWLEEDGLEVLIDRVGNLFGVWRVDSEKAPFMTGSHIDTVVDAGIYDGSYGVLAGLAVLGACRDAGVVPDRSMVVAAFTNEEGVRYAPDMMGSLVHAGGLDPDAALATVGVDGTVLGAELERIGYAGPAEPGAIVPSTFVELHVEQGPVLENAAASIGAVSRLQGISWQKVTISGRANHAGTTPIGLRADAGLAAARIITFLRDLVAGSDAVATVGTISFEPNAINVIPATARFTVDLRDPDAEALRDAERALCRFADDVAARDGVAVEIERLARSDPVTFDETIVRRIESAAGRLGHTCRRVTSGAGHDAQMIARIAPAAMIFVPSRGGISHSPGEHTDDDALVAGAEVLLEVALDVVGEAV